MRSIVEPMVPPVRAWPGRALALGVVVAATWLAGCHRESGDAATDAARGGAPATQRTSMTVDEVKPQAETWPVTLSVTGSIAAWQEASIGAEVPGVRVADVLVNVGDEVRKGQVLATLASSTVADELAVQQASLAEARAGLAQARGDLERALKLRDSGAISAQQISQYETVRHTAEARLKAVDARIRTERTRLGQTQVVASDDGVISQRAATAGAVTQPGQELFRLIRQGRLEWRAEVPSADLSGVTVGRRARIQMPDGTTLGGTVRAIAPTVDAQTRNGLVYVDLDKRSASNGQSAGAEPRAGMYARGEILVGDHRALSVPTSAVQWLDGFAYVFRLDAPPADRQGAPSGSRAVRRVKVGVGRRKDQRIEITEGLSASDVIAGSGVGFLFDGDLVAIGAKPSGAGPTGAAAAGAETAPTAATMASERPATTKP